jgi:hypothetical protein
MLTFSLYNETGRDEEEKKLNLKNNENNENEMKPSKRGNKNNEKPSKTKSNVNIKRNEDDEYESSDSIKNNLTLSSKKKSKKETPEEEVEKIFKMEPTDNVIMQQQSKFIYKIIFDNTKNLEYTQINLDELWTLVSKNKDFSKHNIKNKSDLLDIVIYLDGEGKCLYSPGDKNITLV